MCWNAGVTLAMVGAGAVATVITARRRDPVAIPLTLGYFTIMEALQLSGYAVINQCGSPTNQTITYLSILHIVFQPFLINAFALELVPAAVRERARPWVYGLCAIAATSMLMLLYPFSWAGTCTPGATLCGTQWCTVSGDWHLAWNVPYNGLLGSIGGGFQPYILVAFVLPLFYGAWRLVLFHALAGPGLATLLTSNPNEMPAIWCLFSIGIIGIVLLPRRPALVRVETPGGGAAPAGSELARAPVAADRGLASHPERLVQRDRGRALLIDREVQPAWPARGNQPVRERAQEPPAHAATAGGRVDGHEVDVGLSVVLQLAGRVPDHPVVPLGDQRHVVGEQLAGRGIGSGELRLVQSGHRLEVSLASRPDTGAPRPSRQPRRPG